MEQIINVNTDNRKPYVKPEILHELMLETRAGSPMQPVPEPLREILRNGG
jgi:hypothetical protein